MADTRARAAKPRRQQQSPRGTAAAHRRAELLLDRLLVADRVHASSGNLDAMDRLLGIAARQVNTIWAGQAAPGYNALEELRARRAQRGMG